MSVTFFSPLPPTHHPPLSPPQSNAKAQLALKPYFPIRTKKQSFFLVSTRAIDNGTSAASSTLEEDKPASAVAEKNVLEAPLKSEEPKGESSESNGSPPMAVTATAPAPEIVVSNFQDPRWVNGTWDLNQFKKDGKTTWDAVIDAEAKRRKWLEDNPESSSNEDPVVFDTSIIPWWAWIKRYHLPEAELLNGRAAMVGFFMAYLVDSLTGVGLVDQTNNFFCKTLLFVAVVGVLVIRKKEDIENVKMLVEESTFYDKQWQATWQDGSSSSLKEDQ